MPISTFSTQVGSLTPSLAILLPTRCQQVPNLTPKIAQDSPTCRQDRPKYSPRASNQTLQDSKMEQKRYTVVRFSTCAIFAKIAPKTSQIGQHSCSNGILMAILVPTWTILAPSRLQLGSILTHSGEIFDDPSPAQFLVDFSCQSRSSDLPDPPIFHDFGALANDFYTNSNNFPAAFFRNDFTGITTQELMIFVKSPSDSF